MSQSHLVIDFPIKGPANAKALPELLPPLMPDLAKAQDHLGIVRYSGFMSKGDEKLLFLSDIDGVVDQHVGWLVESAGPMFEAIFKHVDDPAATPAGGVRLHPKSKDPLIGTQNPAESIFVIPQANGGPPIEVTRLSTFVTTKATAYVFLPSITAIKFITNLGEGL